MAVVLSKLIELNPEKFCMLIILVLSKVGVKYSFPPKYKFKLYTRFNQIQIKNTLLWGWDRIANSEMMVNEGEFSVLSPISHHLCAGASSFAVWWQIHSTGGYMGLHGPLAYYSSLAISFMSWCRFIVTVKKNSTYPTFGNEVASLLISTKFRYGAWKESNANTCMYLTQPWSCHFHCSEYMCVSQLFI